MDYPGLLCHTLFVCFVGLFHIGNWNVWLVMALFPGLSYVSVLVLRSVGYMCFELVYLLCIIDSAECHCVPGLFIVVIAECGNRCVRGDGLLLESVVLTTVHKLYRHQ